MAPFIKWWQQRHPGLNVPFPCFVSQQEWAYYLRINPNDDSMLWLVRAMMETELPKPWTCYKALGGDSMPTHGNLGIPGDSAAVIFIYIYIFLLGSHLKSQPFKRVT